jgi:hypothetical protein
VGLDIYLYNAADGSANKLHDDATNAFYDDPAYEAWSESERKDRYDALPEYVSHTDVPSERYPDHLCNRRYLRSSYNAGGFNSAVPEYTGSDHGFYWIFEPMGREWDGDEGQLTAVDIPMLQESRKRTEQVVGELEACDPLRTITVDGNIFKGQPTTTAEEALAWARDELAKERQVGGWWSNLTGEFFGETGPAIIAACPGVGSFGMSGVHLVYRAEDEAVRSYVQTAEIVGEFIDEATSLIEADGMAYISWSG